MRRLARHLMAKAFPKGLPFDELAIVLVDDAAMPECKERCFGVRLQTDVLSQSYLGVPGVAGPTAELVINAERAKQLGKGRAGGAEGEFALYLAHGCDHLAGGEDDTPPRRRAMRRRELRWLRELGAMPMARQGGDGAEPGREGKTTSGKAGICDCGDGTGRGRIVADMRGRAT